MARSPEATRPATPSLSRGFRALATEVRRHLLEGGSEPLPPGARQWLAGGTGADRAAMGRALVLGFGEAVDALVRDGLIEPQIEERLLAAVAASSLRELEFDRDGALTRLARAAARRELLGNRLPAWHVGTAGIARSAPLGIWSAPEVTFLRGPRGRPPRDWAGWCEDEGMLAEGLGKALDLQGFASLGRGRLVVEAEGLRLDAEERWLHLGLHLVRGLELRCDGVLLHADDHRLAIIDAEDDGWFLAELLRLVHEARSAPPPPGDSPPRRTARDLPRSG